MGPKTTVRKQSGISTTAPKRLLALFSDRLNQLLDKYPDQYRTGRGRVVDFAARFNLNLTTARRLLSAEGLPPLEVAKNFADAFGSTVDWLIGGGQHDIDDVVDDGTTRIEVFAPRGNFFGNITVPTWLLPSGIDSSRIVATVNCSDAGTPNQKEEIHLVRIAAEMQDGVPHMFYDPQTDSIFSRTLQFSPDRKQIMTMEKETGLVATIARKDVVFGELRGAKKLCIIGPVIGRISFRP